MGGCALGLTGESVGLCLDMLITKTGHPIESTVSLFGVDVDISWGAEIKEGFDLVSALGDLGKTQERILTEASSHIPECGTCRGEYFRFVYRMAGLSVENVRRDLKATGINVGVPEIYDLYRVAKAVDLTLLGML